MLLNLPRAVAVLYGDGLPKFVSIQPLKTAKSAEAVRIVETDGDRPASPEESISVEPAGANLIDI
jgi:hypothetical protein